MIQIPTRRLTLEKLDALGGLPPAPAATTEDLRQELHTWAFENVEQIAGTYEEMRSSLDRSSEIVTPLRVIARLAGDTGFAGRLEDAIANFVGKPIDPENPSDVLAGVVRRLVQRGFRKVCATHIRLEMGLEMDSTYGRENVSAIPEWARADWIGRELRNRGIVDPRAPAERKRPAAGGSALNLYPIEPEFISEALAGQPGAPVVDPLSWCLTKEEGACGACRYFSVGCELSDRREGRSPSRMRR
ncbi:DUF3631 domain-containing protein [Roseomonas sp. SSH11]|uniref:DUF3631 domain-containing protein n=2 Tax=Pararoseomonas baculiformis TaxID=2820812 RepID=A0ABS4AL58_9PROT|nr:DUF3631 domain-containing protein [Pararoseomonas baculiformis]